MPGNISEPCHGDRLLDHASKAEMIDCMILSSPTSLVAFDEVHADFCPTHTQHPPQVDLYENGTIAIVEAVSPELGNRVQRVRVQLPGTSPELLNKFRAKKVDFAAHSNTEDGGAVFLNLIGG